MRRSMQFVLCLLPLLAGSMAFSESYNNGRCEQKVGRCIDPAKPYTYNRTYVGHDEPSLLFYSNTPGAGNSSIYLFRLPKDPPTLPNQAGTGGTFNFQLHPAFWFGMAICDTQSFPEYTQTCKPDSDSNIFDNPNPNSPQYLGRHPGTAFMEMQFYPPGWVPFEEAISCDATRWCAALNIDSLGFDPANNVANNDACLETVGEETVNFAFITLSGKSQAPANPVEATLATYTPDPTKDLFMNSGDLLRVTINDTSAGVHVLVEDLTTGTSGSMTASAANGFGQVKFDPSGKTCQNIPYNFHPMYSTSTQHTRVPWAAHSYNTAFSDEIGHFEYCDAVKFEGGPCTKAGVSDKGGLDSDDLFCFDAKASLRIDIGGCLDADLDFDGPPYLLDWPGTSADVKKDQSLHPQPYRFTSPLFIATATGNKENYDNVAFETDQPAFEPSCNVNDGSGCTNPPPGAKFYPVYSTTQVDTKLGSCAWQFGGTLIPDTLETFGDSTDEYGPLELLYYQEPFGYIGNYTNFRAIVGHNPCLNTTE
jgi:hypothetical protein